MISFERFTMEDGTPIYLQILRYIKSGIAAGEIANGDELPSRRVLSALLGVNPNTIQKSYRILEEEGLIESRAGAKSYGSLTAEQMATVKEELIETDIRGMIGAIKRTGLSKEEALALIARYWNEIQ